MVILPQGTRTPSPPWQCVDWVRCKATGDAGGLWQLEHLSGAFTFPIFFPAIPATTQWPLPPPLNQALVLTASLRKLLSMPAASLQVLITHTWEAAGASSMAFLPPAPALQSQTPSFPRAPSPAETQPPLAHCRDHHREQGARTLQPEGSGFKYQLCYLLAGSS